jgi:flavin-binding protein dodecin
MSGTNVARVTEIIAESPKGFDDAVQVGFKRAASTLRGITGLRIWSSGFRSRKTRSIPTG